MSRVKAIAIWLLVLGVAGYIDPIALKSTDYRENLVIKGFLPTENSTHCVSISRTSPINDQRFISESGATVWIEDAESNKITFTENLPCRYVSTIAGVPGSTYALHVTLTDHRQYVSDKVVLRNTTPIRQINAGYQSQDPICYVGFYFSVDADDSIGQTRFYCWEFEETLPERETTFSYRMPPERMRPHSHCVPDTAAIAQDKAQTLNQLIGNNGTPTYDEKNISV